MIPLYPNIAATNLSRALRWHPLGLGSWSLSDWYVALAGEIGEVCEVAENIESPPAVIVQCMSDEIGDVYAYADLFAQSRGFEFVQCITTFGRPIYTGTLQTAALSMARIGGKLGDVVKKLNRVRDGLPGNKLTPKQLDEQLLQYIGAVGRQCDVLANRIGLTLHECVARKFNAVSERMGFPERL